MGKIEPKIRYQITPDNSLVSLNDEEFDPKFGAEIFLPHNEEEDDGMVTVVCGYYDDISYVRDDFTVYELFKARAWVEKKREEGITENYKKGRITNGS